MLANCRAWNYTPVEMQRLRITFECEFSDFTIQLNLISREVYLQHGGMYYDSDVNDVNTSRDRSDN